MVLRTLVVWTPAAEIASRLAETGYLADDELATVGSSPCGCSGPAVEGEPGTGKTALAEAIAESLACRPGRLQCYEGIDATQALYDWDFPRQILHLRAMEALRGTRSRPRREGETCWTSGSCSPGQVLRRSSRPRGAVVDEVDRADDEFEAFLLEVLSTCQGEHPRARHGGRPRPPVVVLTSNRTRELHDALSGVASTTGSSTRGRPRARDRAEPRPGGRGPRPPGGQSCKPCGHATTCSSRPGSPRPSTGRARSTTWAPRARPATAAATLGALVKYREDRDKVEASPRPDAPR